MVYHDYIMPPPFDIFRVENDGRLLWKDTAETFGLAKLRIKILMLSLPGDFVIYSQETGDKIVVRGSPGSGSV